jgi:hypothetical protein
MVRALVVLLLVSSVPGLALAQPSPASSLAERTAGLQRADGFVPFYWDASRAAAC